LNFAAQSKTDGKPLRVLQIGKYFDPDQGGVETVTLDISKGLALHNVVADVLCFSKTATYPPYQGAINVFRAKTNFTLSQKSVSIDYLFKVHSLSSKYDVGLLHMPNPIGMIAALLFWRKPLVLIWHADIISYPVIGRILKPLEKMLIRKASSIISPTPAHTNGSYLAGAMQSKVVPGAYPFSKDKLHSAGQAEPMLDKIKSYLRGRRLILAVGRLVPYKGFDVLIEAATQLDPMAVICIAGSGPLEQELRQRIMRAGLDDKIILLGSVSDAELSCLYKLAYVVTMPSVTRAEMYGMTQVEAMSFGKPLVSTNIPMSGVSWVNQDDVSGIVVSAGDSEALVNALNRLISDKACHEKLSRGAIELFDNTHDLASSSKHYASILARASKI
jgi:glycosyltransferase involved in cell wall biosynthesis